MTLTQKEIDNLIRKSSEIAHDEIPTSTSEKEEKLLIVLKNNEGKWFSAKELNKLFNDNNAKWYSDKLWNLAKKGVIEKGQTRGYYRFVSKGTSQ